jgi:adenylate kinase family enzyme
VSIVGNAGAGKSRFAQRLVAELGAPWVELDAIHHLPNWQPVEADVFYAVVDKIASTDAWVIDGNYRTVVVDGPVWRRADTVVWLDLPRWTVMRQVTVRSLRRVVRRERLWNDNQEPVRNLLAWDPHLSIIRWAWAQHHKYQDRFGSAMASAELSHLEFVRITSRRQAKAFLARQREQWMSQPELRRRTWAARHDSA